MSEYWKSTPNYWCKFCEVYVRDTGIERKNHEASARHQNSIQRSLRELHKGQAKVQSDQDKAKAEISRLNNLVGSKSTGTKSSQAYAAPVKVKTVAAPAAKVDYAASHRAQMKQLVAMGIHVPDSNADDVAAGGGWQAVPESFIDVPSEGAVDTEAARIKGVHKRKAEDDEEVAEEQSGKRRIWGSSLKSYPGKAAEEDASDLDALLSGISKKPEVSASAEVTSAAADEVKQEATAVPSIGDDPDVKQEITDSTVTAPPIVTFKKRKSKR